MLGQTHPNYGLATILLAHDPLSSLVYPMTTKPIKSLVAWQWPTNIYRSMVM